MEEFGAIIFFLQELRPTHDKLLFDSNKINIQSEGVTTNHITVNCRRSQFLFKISSILFSFLCEILIDI
jgi:hypothetical protein